MDAVVVVDDDVVGENNDDTDDFDDTAENLHGEAWKEPVVAERNLYLRNVER